MSGRIVIAAFRPKAGKERELLQVIADRLPLLRSLRLATARESITMRSKEGVIVDVSEWVSEEAIARAHETPEVRALWERFDTCSEYVTLESLAEVGAMFANFEPVTLPTATG